MKKNIYTLVLCLVLTLQANAQSIASNDDTQTPTSSTKVTDRLPNETDVDYFDRLYLANKNGNNLSETLKVFGEKYFNEIYKQNVGEKYGEYIERIRTDRRKYSSNPGMKDLINTNLARLQEEENEKVKQFYTHQNDSIKLVKQNEFLSSHPNYEENCATLKAKYISIVNDGAKVGNALALIQTKSANISHNAFGQSFFDKTKVKGNDKIMYNSLVTKLKNLEASWMKLQNIEDNDTSLNKWMYIDAMVESDLVDVRTIMKSNAQNVQLIR